MAFVGRFFLLVLFMGFVELYLLVGAARSIGFFATLGLCVLTGVVGGSLVRLQGLRTMQQVNGSMARGELPTREIVSGVVLMIVGVLLIMPGFITDVVGFLMLIPPLRLGAAALLVRGLEKRLKAMPGGGPFAGNSPSPGGAPFPGGPFPGGPFPGGPFPGRGPGPRGPVIEAEAEVIGAETDGDDDAKRDDAKRDKS